jgi:hypothetical protein
MPDQPCRSGSAEAGSSCTVAVSCLTTGLPPTPRLARCLSKRVARTQVTDVSSATAWGTSQRGRPSAARSKHVGVSRLIE